MKLEIKRILVNKWPEIIKEVDIPKDISSIGLAIAIIQESKAHFHRKTTEIYYIVEGTGTIFLDGQKTNVESGDIILIRPGTVHKVVSSSEEPIKLLCISIPRYNPRDVFYTEK